MAYYSDLRQFIIALEKKGKLVRIKKELVKETEIPSLFWLQYRGLPETEWKSFLFENVEHPGSKIEKLMKIIVPNRKVKNDFKALILI